MWIFFVFSSLFRSCPNICAAMNPDTYPKGKILSAEKGSAVAYLFAILIAQSQGQLVTCKTQDIRILRDHKY